MVSQGLTGFYQFALCDSVNRPRVGLDLVVEFNSLVKLARHHQSRYDLGKLNKALRYDFICVNDKKLLLLSL